MREAAYNNKSQNCREEHRGGIQLNERGFESVQKLENDRLLEIRSRHLGDCCSGGHLSRLYSVSHGSLFALQLTSSAMPVPVIF
jgi:hypothetical protein